MSRTEDIYIPALEGKQIPILTLDHKWHRLFTQTEPSPEILQLEEIINELLKRQGKCRSESNQVKALKKRLMEEILILAQELDRTKDKKKEKRLKENRRLIADCNQKYNDLRAELEAIPQKLEEANRKLMLLTMEICYSRIKENTQLIEEITLWVDEVRIELKKKLVRRQEKEDFNHQLYSYMHDVFGADVIEIFDMKYLPDQKKGEY